MLEVIIFYIVFDVILSVFVANIANKSMGKGPEYFFISLFLAPIFTLLLLIADLLAHAHTDRKGISRKTSSIWKVED